MSWVALQLSAAVEDGLRLRGGDAPAHYNPKPPGRYCSGGAPEAVLGWLLQRRSPLAWWSMTQLIGGTGRSAKACSWAVIYLNRLGYVERERDVANSRYLRYRASASARAEFLKQS